MSLERKAAKKQIIDLSNSSAQTSAKRENNFINKGVSSNQDPKNPSAKIKQQMNQMLMGEEVPSERFRKATLSPP